MRGFASRSTVDQALAWLDSQLTPLPGDTVAAAEAAGRVLAHDVHSERNVPSFARAMMDGYAVRAQDTVGASSYNRLPLEVVGESLPGKGTAVSVETGQTVRIMTGAPMPSGADAVLPVERTEGLAASSQQNSQEQVAALDAVSPGKHVGLPGEDIQAGALLLSAGRRLRAQDIGLLVSIGIASVEVVRKPRVRIVVTGNELLPPGAIPEGYRIVDSNSPMLAAMIERDGGQALNPGIVPDEPDEVLAALRAEADVVIVSGGSSVGKEDYAPGLIAEHGELAIHGVAMRPSSPVGMGKLDGRLVFLLPGNPVSCLCAYDFFASRAIRALGGRQREWAYPSRSLALKRKLVSTVGRVDYARVCVVDGLVEPVAISGASMLSSTSRADGFVVIPGDSEGYAAGTVVDVFFYDTP